MAYIKSTNIIDKLQIDKIFRDEIYDEVKRTIEELVKTNKKIPKKYVELAIMGLQNEIDGSNLVDKDNYKIEDIELFDEIYTVIKQCIINLTKSGNKPTQDKLLSAFDKCEKNYYQLFY